jgi:ATP-dependent protease ClpP protease subunit/phage major head subunit gpT-like protein
MDKDMTALLAQAAALAAEVAEAPRAALPRAEAHEMTIDGVIGWDVTAAGVRESLRAIPDDAPLTLRVNSPGGIATEGFAIYNLLAQRKGKTTARVEGLAASAASYIIMAATRVEMAEASFLMIHNASVMTWGNKEDHDASRALLAKIDELMVRIYARRTGGDPDEIAAMMTAETWLTGDEAKAHGFADAVLKAPAAARAMAPLSHEARTLLAEFRRPPASIAALAHTSSNPPHSAAPPTKEIQMGPEDITSGGASAAAKTNPPTVPAPVAATAVELAQLAGKAGLGVDWVQAQAQAGVTLSDARAAALDAMAEAHAAAVTPSPLRIVRDAGDTLRSRVHASLVASMRNLSHANTPEAAREFRGVGIAGMLREMMAASGVRDVGRLNNEQLWQRVATAQGSHSTGDFPIILKDAINVTLQQEYGEFPRTFESWTEPTEVADFKQITSAQIGRMPTLTQVTQGQPIPHRPIREEGEVYQVNTYAGIVAMTREMIINDQLNAFGRTIRGAAEAANRALSDLVYVQLTANANMADGNKLFSASHANVGTGASGTVFHYLVAAGRPGVEVAYLTGRRVPEITEEVQFDVLGVSYRVVFDFGAKAVSWRGLARERAAVNTDGSTVGKLEELLLVMRGVDGELMGVPRGLVLLVPPSDHLAARRLVTAVTPDSAANVNPYAGLQLVVEPRLGNTTVV